MIWIRNKERYNREPWKTILLCFLWGASIAVIFSLILEVILEIPFAIFINDYTTFSFITAILIAPVVEEFTKPLIIGSKTVKKELDEIEDGLIYGAAAGLGFSAAENLLYESTFLSQGLFIFLILVFTRTIGGCLLHASATAITGYGYSKSLLAKKRLISTAPYFVIAIVIHSFYNFIVSFEIIGAFISIGLGLLFAIFLIRFVNKKIIKLDKTSNLINKPLKKEISQLDRRCPDCDRIIPFDANICPYCAKKFYKSESNEVKVKCDSCGFEIQLKDNFCRNCGKKIKK